MWSYANFRMPIPGTYELVCFLGAVAVAFAMAYTSLEKGHVSVSFIVALFPQRIQGLIKSITHLFGYSFCSHCLAGHIYANDLRLSGEVSLTLELPFYPFVYGIAISAAAVSLILIFDLFKNVRKMIGK